MSTERRKRVAVNLRLDPDLLERIDAAALERDLGRNALVSRLLERGLGQLAPILTGELAPSNPWPGSVPGRDRRVGS